MALPARSTSMRQASERLRRSSCDENIAPLVNSTEKRFTSAGFLGAGSLGVAEMQAAFDTDVPGLHQMPANRTGRRIDHAAVADRQFRRRSWPQVPDAHRKMGVYQDQ